nr:probable oxidoreductase [Kibdelosporangium sp. MJ126-NF4]CTQ88705.1 probable oxidoreductase [Kibdelosporangium sp. MJ126-NF4]
MFNMASPVDPADGMVAHTVADVQAAISRAVSKGLRVRTYTTGHASGTYGPMDDALLIRTELEGGVRVDADARTARIPAGTLWGEVVAATSPHGLVAMHGTSSTVGVVGYLLRGGIGFYSRAFGLAPNTIRSVELVTADGEHRTADGELLWALRGGGGGFGVVTAVEIDLFPVTSVITGASFWPVSQAQRIVKLWRDWAQDAPESVSTTLRLMNMPPGPGRPESVTSGQVICVDGAIIGDAPDIRAAREIRDSLLGPLGEPLYDTWREAGPEAVTATHMDPPNPVKAFGDHMLLTDIDPDVFVQAAGQGSPLLAAELRQLGGAIARPHPDGGVLDHIADPLLYQCVGSAADPETIATGRRWADKIRAELAPWDTGRTLPSFVGSNEQPQRHLDAEQIVAVDRVRQRVDPGGLFRGDISPHTTVAV